MSRKRTSPPDVSHRLALTVSEAAELVGLCENTFRAHLMPDCPKFWAGRSVRIPLEGLRRYVDDLSQREATASERSLDEILKDIE